MVRIFFQEEAVGLLQLSASGLAQTHFKFTICKISKLPRL